MANNGIRLESFFLILVVQLIFIFSWGYCFSQICFWNIEATKPTRVLALSKLKTTFSSRLSGFRLGGKNDHDDGGISRRDLIESGLCLGTFSMAQTAIMIPDKTQAAPEKSKLEDRLESQILKNPGGARFGDPKQLFLPVWLFGTWNVKTTFTGAFYPMGTKYVPAKFRGGNIRSPGSPPGSTVSYVQKYFSTLPDTTENQIKVSLGQVPKSQVVPDRAFNTRALLNAYSGYNAVEEVQYDPRKNPLQLSVLFSTIGPDLRPLGPGKMEIYLNKLEAEDCGKEYFTSEYQRSVSVGSRSVLVTDAEVLTKYTNQNNGSITGQQRISTYLVPNPNDAEGAMYMEVGGKAVAVYDYSFQMERINNGCVETPKGYIQCS